VTAELVDRARALAVSVLAWTVDGADEMRRLAAKGVDTIVTNEVERAVAAVGGRGRRPC
jgi:glycerophosphoryl diester phosphodiesterase